MTDFVQSLLSKGWPLKDNRSIAVCSKGGINLLSREKVKLEAMSDTLKYMIDALSTAKTRTEGAMNPVTL